MTTPNREDTTRQPETLPVAPLRSLVMFPGVVLSLEVSGPAWVRLADEIIAGRTPRSLVLATPTRDEDDLQGALGVKVEVLHVHREAEDKVLIVVRGLERRRIAAVTQREPLLTAEVEPVVEIVGAGADFDQQVRAVRDLAVQLIQVTDAPKEAAELVESLDSPGILADRVAANAGLSLSERIDLLAELDVGARLTRLRGALDRRLAELAAEAKDTGDPRLRERVLREKMAQLKEELGEAPDTDSEELARKIDSAGMPPEAEQAARRELRRLRGLSAQSPEYPGARDYLDWLVALPWSKRSQDNLDLAQARRILDEDHSGLEKIKRRVVEHLAVRVLNPKKKGPILLLYGPPGVGKTSLGRSIARTLGREFARISLGGVRDEAEIRGHRRTYIGALPGRIIQALRRVGSKNPVFMLDEIDKLGEDFRGDPSAALLEVLDPEQNGTFSDHYVEVPFDLSEVMFIATANDLASIPPPLLDRLEVLSIAGYTTAEKRQIARAHLLPRQLQEHGLEPTQVSFGPGIIDELIESYTREPGVRNLERAIASVVRGVAVKVAAGEVPRLDVGVDDLPEYLGPPRFVAAVAEPDPQPGIATGMAWTPAGGEILFVEATRMPGSGQLLVTGRLGDVMKESAQAAFSFVRAHADELGIAPGILQRSDIHLHMPAGGVAKDGPSAGNAIASAFVSLLTGRPLRGDVAMTGEVTLRGHVLPVGGIASKVLAAHRAGIRRVVLPARNAQDVAEIPADVRKELDIRLVSRLWETLEVALAPRADERPAMPANSNWPIEPAPVAISAV